MKIKTILAGVPFILGLCACQSEVHEETISDDNAPKHLLTVKASLPSSDNTRALIEYGYGHKEGEDMDKEIFQWYKDEENQDKESDILYLYNISHFSENHIASGAETPSLVISKILGKTAEFESITEFPNFSIKSGDILLAILGFSHVSTLADANGLDNVIAYEAHSGLYDQIIIKEPEKNQFSALRHLHKMMHMYDIVKVEEDGVIPELHFKYLSAIIRITLRNETGGDLFTKPTEINFTYPTGNDCSFIFGFSKFSVVGDEENGYYLKENFKQDGTTFIANDCSHFVNKSESGIPLPSGETYELYAVIPPRIGNQLTGESFFIDLYDGVKSGYGKYDDCIKYPIEIPDFNIPIEPGKRYWFNLTATKENDEPKLMFTNKWKKAHPEAQ